MAEITKKFAKALLVGCDFGDDMEEQLEDLLLAYFKDPEEYAAMTEKDWEALKKDIQFHPAKFPISRGRISRIVQQWASDGERKEEALDLPDGALPSDFGDIPKPVFPSTQVVDDQFASFGLTLSEFLKNLPPDVEGINLRSNGLTQLGELGSYCAEHRNLRFIDLSFNRIYPTKENYKSILDILNVLEPRNGVLVIHNNPIASVESTSWFELMIKQKPKCFCRLIWIPFKWLEAKTWMNAIPNSKPGLDRKIIQYHMLFYTSVPAY